MLTWTSIGADRLTASWASGSVPFAGAVTTTMDRSGTFSYQITGTINGSYCGGAGVEVDFSGDTPSHAATSSATPPPSHGGHGGSGNSGNGGNRGSGHGGSGNGGGGNGVAAVHVGKHGRKYPAQSPTGGSGVSFIEKPLNLLCVGAAAFLLSLALWKREKIRAPFVHQH